ncbi:cupin domain-containing protein (plasmid) [Haloferax mediterranei ATCC 33500]|uniref:Cupin n=1 Tax=Haloferax mediterranei (strain ATCC 33500 / DSM 1411 / JCM 8866 / NBRC 14739 / NCIMB 2177 / R-4) TaxID=523841 RepID=I3R9X4_HALMT|nr:cupin domain-containing protein [Haloferax mediterranei]AFK21034.1 cupin 2 domain-containing protein [Haloferax mediterranei ATCC 33500]AHZ24105.1 cupin [Haloferax mediterranei ATCC 33500]EMA05180.1 cupin [Haloferax mediterranei ATCC 33500]MDX5989745.1 cupin domain-containing protein [Haloferax mediterranei ATCC 33500]QCQ77195.1 cupin domain-containing protein [Haloferax mediterranei ATCC 33500]
MSDIELTDLEDVWQDSTESPLTLFETDDPESQTGSYVIQPGERVPAAGWTSHEGDEISVILDGSVELVTPDGQYTVSEGSLSVIPSGVEHYSVNETDEPVRLVYTVLGGL